MLTNIQIPEQLLEVLRLQLVIVEAHHIDEQTLAETARTDEYQRVRLSLQYWKVHCLIHIVEVPVPNRPEVRNSVRYLPDLFHFNTSISVLLQN